MIIRRIAAAGVAAAVLMGAAGALAQESSSDALDAAVALTETDPAAAYAAFERLAAAGDPEAKNGMAAILERGVEGVPADPDRAQALLKEAAAEGSDFARLNLSVRLLMNGEAGDDAEAVAMLERITHPDLKTLSQWPLGRAYLFGHGVEQDLGRGSRMLIASLEAEPDNTDANYLVGRAYTEGWGIDKNPAAAFEHLKVAAHGGDERAQWLVGMMLLNGDGTTADAALARRYVEASAESGYDAGMISMAVMLALGQGGPVDAPAARVWYQRAAETGSAHALRGLAGMLLVGEGGPRDVATGAAYLDLAAKAGDELAPQMQQSFAAEIAAVGAGRIEAAKAAWLREHGTPH